jgi:hypothetical protein
MSAASARAKVAEWREGSKGFFRWLEDTRPMVPASKGGYEAFVPGPRERAEIARALDGGFSTIVLCWPRRHGKTLVSALIIVWRFLTRQTQNIAIIANSEKQTVDTAFKTVRTILEQTPYTKALIASGAVVVTADKIAYEAVGNVIQGFSANPAALYGKKLSVAQISELHAATSDAAYQVLASSTIDTDDGLVLVDSTTGPRSSPLFALYSIAQQGTDPSLFFSHIGYRDLEDACTNAPRWISPAKLRSRAAQMLPAEFAQQHLNQWTAGTSALFPPEIIARCRDVYRLDVGSVTGGAAHVVGAGLDRAYGFSLHGDATVTTCVLKVLVGEDDHFFVMASDKIAFSSAGGIRRALTRYRTEFGMKRAAIESYNSQDIAAWCGDQPFEHEVIHPTAERQANAFTALYNAAAEGRLHIHPSFEALFSEMGTFEYRLVPGSTGPGGAPRFEAAKGCHDDHVYSLAWAVYSLRDVELNPYEIEGIYCHGPAPAVPLCILNGGDLVPPCANSCRSMLKVRGLYRGYVGRGHLAPLAFDEFVKAKVRNIGAHTVPR